MRFDVITLFPQMFDSLTEYGVTGRAWKNKLWTLGCWNPRDYTEDVHRTVDDRPYGGGPGMVMIMGPLERALFSAQRARGADNAAPIVLMSPTGAPFTQATAQQWADGNGAILVCGRYEGIDQRFIDRYVTQEYSLGDFVLSGGEIAAQAMIDSTVRLLPGALNHDLSAASDSFHEGMTGLLDSPHYTRPEVYGGQVVPAVLRSGDHQAIALWRRQQSLFLTRMRRPELLEEARHNELLSRQDLAFLDFIDQKSEHEIRALLVDHPVPLPKRQQK